jgi:hypothetical protein
MPERGSDSRKTGDEREMDRTARCPMPGYPCLRAAPRPFLSGRPDCFFWISSLLAPGFGLVTGFSSPQPEKARSPASAAAPRAEIRTRLLRLIDVRSPEFGPSFHEAKVFSDRYQLRRMSVQAPVAAAPRGWSEPKLNSRSVDLINMMFFGEQEGEECNHFAGAFTLCQANFGFFWPLAHSCKLGNGHSLIECLLVVRSCQVRAARRFSCAMSGVMMMAQAGDRHDVR